jgi:hypothetical protein
MKSFSVDANPIDIEVTCLPKFTIDVAPCFVSPAYQSLVGILYITMD